jgi:hypothetical protein
VQINKRCRKTGTLILKYIVDYLRRIKGKMPFAEFGIIDCIDKERDYLEYGPEKYKCIRIRDDIYVDEWWEKLICIKTYFHN